MLSEIKKIKLLFSIVAFLTIATLIFKHYTTSPIITIRSAKYVQSVTSPKVKIPESHAIPQILHYIYKDELAPIQYEPLIKRCFQINSDMTPILWTDKDATKFVKDHYPESFDMFSKYSLALQKSDALRYFILYHYGGVYLDMDVYCEKSFTKGFDLMHESCIIDQERNEFTNIWHNMEFYAMNSVMACQARHPFFQFVYKTLSKFVNAGEEIRSTGPFFLTNVLIQWRKLENNLAYVTLAHPEVFTPNFPANKMTILREKCKNYQSRAKTSLFWKGCHKFHEANWTDSPEVFVNDRTLARHLFLNLGYSWNQHSIKSRFNLTAKFSSFKRYLNSELDHL